MLLSVCAGMQARQPIVAVNTETNRDRLRKLAGFQLTLLRFALTRFPAVKRVVYSTCSLNVEENEQVIEVALNSKYHNFKVTSAGRKLPGWINFGSEKYSFASKCIYSRPETDLTNGFFMAVFKRRKDRTPIQLVKLKTNCDEVLPNTHSGIKHDITADGDEFGNKKDHHQRLSSHNKFSTRSVEHKLLNIKPCEGSTTINVSHGEPVVTTIKKRSKKRVADSTCKFSPPRKLKKGNESNIYNPSAKGKECNASIVDNNVNKISLNRTLTTSKKKRKRASIRKLQFLQTHNNVIMGSKKKTINHKLKEKNLNTTKNSKNEPQANISSPKGKNKISKSKLKRVRKKKQQSLK